MNKINIFLVFLVTALLFACKPGEPNTTVNQQATVESIKLFAQDRPGGERFDFEMPIDKGLDKLEVTELTYVGIDSNELVLGVSLDEIQLAVPIRYLSGFEVANFALNDHNFLLTWCPLVGSARIFEGEVNGNHSGFDFGRGLVDNNLLIVDRKTNSVWNQLSRKSIKGELEGQRLRPIVSLQCTWDFWKDKYPHTKILINQDTSHAVFPDEVYDKPYYHTWIPGDKYSRGKGLHQIKNLGIGIELEDSTAFFSFVELFQTASPIAYKLNDTALNIHFDKAGLAAWVTDTDGKMIPSTIVYNWAWKNFFPKSRIYKH